MGSHTNLRTEITGSKITEKEGRQEEEDMSGDQVEMLERQTDGNQLVIFHHPDGGLWVVVEVALEERGWRILWRREDEMEVMVEVATDDGRWRILLVRGAEAELGVEVAPEEGMWRILLGGGFQAREEASPLSEERIQELTRRSLTDQELDRTPSCPVCLEDFQKEEEVLLSGCSNSHPGHISCISRWLRVKGQCPVCREELREQEEQGEQEVQEEQVEQEMQVDQEVHREQEEQEDQEEQGMQVQEEEQEKQEGQEVQGEQEEQKAQMVQEVQGEHEEQEPEIQEQKPEYSQPPAKKRKE